MLVSVDLHIFWEYFKQLTMDTIYYLYFINDNEAVYNAFQKYYTEGISANVKKYLVTRSKKQMRIANNKVTVSNGKSKMDIVITSVTTFKNEIKGIIGSLERNKSITLKESGHV